VELAEFQELPPFSRVDYLFHLVQRCNPVSCDTIVTAFRDDEIACRRIHYHFDARPAIKEQSICDAYLSHFPHPVNSFFHFSSRSFSPLTQRAFDHPLRFSNAPRTYRLSVASQAISESCFGRWPLSQPEAARKVFRFAAYARSFLNFCKII